MKKYFMHLYIESYRGYWSVSSPEFPDYQETEHIDLESALSAFGKFLQDQMEKKEVKK